MNQESVSAGRKRRTAYTEEFECSVVDDWCHGNRTAEQVASEFGVSV
jgi:hypothetical protein